MSISFQSQYSSKIQEWVMSGLFEIGICETPLLHDGLNAHAISVECRLAIPQGSDLARHEVLTPERLAGEPLVVMGPDHMTHRHMREAFQAAGVPWKPRVHAHLFKNLLSFVKEGMGVAILDPFVLDFDREGGFVSRSFRPQIQMEMAVITAASRPLSAIGQEFHDCLIAQLQSYALNAQ